MARLGMAPRIIGLFILVLGLLAGGLFWFDFLGIINARQIMSPVLGIFGQAEQVVDIDDPVLLDTIRIRKQEEAIDLRYQELQNSQNTFAEQELEFNQRLAELGEREKAQDDREKSFIERVTRYDNRYANLVQNSRYLTGMRPEEAVKIMNGYDDQDLIDTLRVTQELADAEGTVSLVSFWLSQMDPVRSAEIQRKMTLKPPLDE